MNDFIKSVIHSDSIPTPPGVALRLMEVYEQENVEIEEIAQIVCADPALAAKLIAYCNSPILGRSRQITSLNEAVLAAGMRATKIIALSFSLMQTGSQESTEFDLKQFWNQSLATAISARLISEHLGRPTDAAFLNGLMLNIGAMAIACTFPAEYGELISKANKEGKPLVDLEREQWSEDRYSLGIQLLMHWNFPPEMVSTIKEYSETNPTSNLDIKVLQLASQISSALFKANLSLEQIDTVRENASTNLAIPANTFNPLFDQIAADWCEHAKLLELPASQSVSIKSLELQAKQQITQLSLDLAAENMEIQRQNLDLKTKAMIDGLTGLKNRRAFDLEAEGILSRSRKNDHLFVLMIMDIDFFKAVNDTYGHHTGDLVLSTIGQVLQNKIRDEDCVFRIGGEEFVAVLSNCEPQFALAAAERLRAAVEATELYCQTTPLKVTISVGVTFCDASNDLSLEELLEQADQQLYRAKNNGRNQCCSHKIESNSQSTNTQSESIPPVPSSNIGTLDGPVSHSHCDA